MASGGYGEYCRCRDIATFSGRLKPNAMERLSNEPSDSDEKGYIYMYQKTNPKNKQEANMYKIGQTKDSPGKRVRRQQNKNMEGYEIVCYEKTNYKQLAEKVTHDHLELSRVERKYGDGKTEWFIGDEDYLAATIAKSCGMVNRRYN